MNETKKYLTVAELAKRLGVSRVTVFRKIKSGGIKAEKIGRNFFIPVSEIFSDKVLTEEQKQEIKKIVRSAVKEYSETFKLLGKE